MPCCSCEIGNVSISDTLTCIFKSAITSPYQLPLFMFSRGQEERRSPGKEHVKASMAGYQRVRLQPIVPAVAHRPPPFSPSAERVAALRVSSCPKFVDFVCCVALVFVSIILPLRALFCFLLDGGI
jgi:hypothetical protein